MAEPFAGNHAVFVAPDGTVTDPNAGPEPEEPSEAAVQRATAILARAALEPEAVAAENAQLRSSIKGAHALLHALVKRSGLDTVVNVAREDWQTHDPREELRVEPQPDGSVNLTVHRQNRAERRAEGRSK